MVDMELMRKYAAKSKEMRSKRPPMSQEAATAQFRDHHSDNIMYVEYNDITLNKRLPEDSYIANFINNTSIYFSPIKKNIYLLNNSEEDLIQLGGQELRRLAEIYESALFYELSTGNKPKTILLAEDDINMHRLLFEKIGEVFGNDIKIIGFLDVNSAYDFFTRHANDIDLIISCINIPKMNGVKFLQMCKNFSPRKPFIIYSAIDYRNDFSSSVAEAYIDKSPDMTELIPNISKLLDLE